jgi:hypothetical protein
VISAATLELAMRKAMAMGVQVTSLHWVDYERFVGGWDVTRSVPHTAFKSIARGVLTFDER